MAGYTRTSSGICEAPAPGRAAKRVLSLDSGGFHVFATLAYLERIEAVLRSQSRLIRGFRLSDYFDLMGGSGTGALVAAGLATGRTAQDMMDVVTDLARDSLTGRRWWARGTGPTFKRAVLLSTLHELFGSTELRSGTVRTGLALVAHRVDGRHRTMILSNRTPLGVPAKPSLEPRLGLTIADAIRASLPTLERGQLEIVRCGPGMQGAFRDAGSGPHVNPAMALMLLATARQDRADGPGLGWPTGADALMLTSVGAVRGMAARRAEDARGPDEARDTALMTEAMVQSMAAPVTPCAPLPEVTGGLAPDSLRAEPSFTYARYALDLSRDGLKGRVSRTLSHLEADRLRRIDGFARVAPFLSLAREVAEADVRAEQFPVKFQAI